MNNIIKILHVDAYSFQYQLKKDIYLYQLMELFSISKKRWNQYAFKNNKIENIQSNTLLEKDSICCHTFKKDDYYAYSDKDIDIIYEDTICIAVNKPAFLLVHSDGNEKDTLQNRVDAYLYEKGWPFSSQPIHRIDYETSGIILFCKYPFFQGLFDQQFLSHSIVKEYYCVVQGRIAWNTKTIDAPISRNRHKANCMIIHPKGKVSISHFTVLERNTNTLLKVKIDTGRKHQIRLHLSSINHPIINDNLYGTVIDNRGLLLQNFHLKFKHPLDNQWIDLKLDMDPRFK
ncbi:MAG: RluA family pseudouridine synthase [Holdemanella sp.]|nr:RluA family pseudouridine synthase [Holdemanella sp.]